LTASPSRPAGALLVVTLEHRDHHRGQDGLDDHYENLETTGTASFFALTFNLEYFVSRESFVSLRET
jgi:hypothetical protein